MFCAQKMQTLTATQKNLPLLQALTGLPGLMFDALTLIMAPVRPDLPSEAPFHWHTCTN